MKINLQKFQLPVSILFFLLCCGLLYFFYVQIKNNYTVAKELETDMQEKAKYIEEIRSLGQSLRSTSRERTELDSHFASSANLVPFLDTLEDLGPVVGAEVGISSVDMTGDGTGLLVGLEASGSFVSLYKFLKLLENAPYELEITNFDIYKKSQTATTSGWEATARVKLISFIK